MINCVIPQSIGYQPKRNHKKHYGILKLICESTFKNEVAVLVLNCEKTTAA